MEILYKGTDPNEKHWLSRCSPCGTIVRAKRSELTGPLQGGDYRSDGDYFSESKCPVCNRRILFYEEESRSANTIEEALLKVTPR